MFSLIYVNFLLFIGWTKVGTFWSQAVKDLRDFGCNWSNSKGEGLNWELDEVRGLNWRLLRTPGPILQNLENEGLLVFGEPLALKHLRQFSILFAGAYRLW